MGKTNKPLMTRGKLALCFAALAIGAGLSLFRQWRATGIIDRQTIVVSMSTLAIGVALVFVVRWWANRPDRGRPDE